MRQAALIILVPLLAGCDVETRNPADGDETVKIQADESGQVNFNLPFASGKVKLPEGSLSESQFDIDGVKMIPGGRVTSFNLDAGDKGGTVNFGFTAPASPADASRYFTEQFKAKGVETAVAGNSVTGTTKDGDPFEIRIEPATQGSQGTITIRSDK